MTSPFDPRSPQDVFRLIADYPLAWVVSHGGGDFHATPLPLLAEFDATGNLVSLLGHIGRRNPQTAHLQAFPEALVLFTGPNGYISPAMAEQSDWGPTWNYAVARFTVRIDFVPDETDAAVAKLVAKAEGDIGGSWTAGELGARYEGLAARIVAFRASIVTPRATFKLGQDERPEVFAAIVRNTPDAALAAWMREQLAD